MQVRPRFTSKGESSLEADLEAPLSLGGRVVLLNYVLNSTPIFSFSLWKLPVKIFEVVVYSWQLLRNRIAFRDNMLRYIVFSTRDSRCCLCDNPLELLSHLFISCDTILSVWYGLVGWLGWQWASDHDVDRFFNTFQRWVLIRGSS